MYVRSATYELRSIHTIINAAPVLHVSFTPDPADPFPAILPMIGVMGFFEFPSADIDEAMDCYLHGYVSSRVMNLARETASNGSEGLPVCIAATKVDGIVLSLTPNSHSYNYRSAILHGYASLVTSDEEKLWAMELITNSIVSDRWDHTRVPPDNAEMQSTRILRVRIVSGSGKIRDGMPHDDNKDTRKDEIVDRVWTGVVPVYESYGEPIPGPSNRVQPIPSHVTDHVKILNQQNKSYALDAVEDTTSEKRGKDSDK
ncbi:MAG: hypothetical protein M1812_007647 [Candelaria pacifica]|nr:MAG: hypothetical protein M1812_007647 [Candelaria pacifica]